MTRPPSLAGRQAHRVEFGLRFAEFGQNAQCFGGLGVVDAAHGEADMDQDPIPRAGRRGVFVADDAGDVDLPLDAADVDGRQLPFDIVDFLDTAWDPKAHMVLIPWFDLGCGSWLRPRSDARRRSPPVRAQGLRRWRELEHARAP